MESMGSGQNKLKNQKAAGGGAIERSTEAAELSGTKKKLIPRFLQGAVHPGYCMLHIIFKISALASYILLGLLIDDKTFCFLIVIILSAIDFWLVKNVTGRILVGLRWWSKIDDAGKETWYFESLGEARQTNKTDSMVFWFACYAIPIIWLIFAITSVISLRFSQLTICMIGCGLAGVNLLGYIRCEKNHKSYLKGFLVSQAKKNISKETMAKVGTMDA